MSGIGPVWPSPKPHVGAMLRHSRERARVTLDELAAEDGLWTALDVADLESYRVIAITQITRYKAALSRIVRDRAGTAS